MRPWPLRFGRFLRRGRRPSDQLLLGWRCLNFGLRLRHILLGAGSGLRLEPILLGRVQLLLDLVLRPLTLPSSLRHH